MTYDFDNTISEVYFSKSFEEWARLPIIQAAKLASKWELFPLNRNGNYHTIDTAAHFPRGPIETMRGSVRIRVSAVERVGGLFKDYVFTAIMYLNAGQLDGYYEIKSDSVPHLRHYHTYYVNGKIDDYVMFTQRGPQLFLSVASDINNTNNLELPRRQDEFILGYNLYEQDIFARVQGLEPGQVDNRRRQTGSDQMLAAIKELQRHPGDYTPELLHVGTFIVQYLAGSLSFIHHDRFVDQASWNPNELALIADGAAINYQFDIADPFNNMDTAGTIYETLSATPIAAFDFVASLLP